jgi:hypothetical protein
MNIRTKVFAAVVGLVLLLAGIGLGRALADEVYIPLVSGGGSVAAQVSTATPLRQLPLQPTLPRRPQPRQLSAVVTPNVLPLTFSQSAPTRPTRPGQTPI